MTPGRPACPPARTRASTARPGRRRRAAPPGRACSRDTAVRPLVVEYTRTIESSFHGAAAVARRRSRPRDRPPSRPRWYALKAAPTSFPSSKLRVNASRTPSKPFAVQPCSSVIVPPVVRMGTITARGGPGQSRVRGRETALAREHLLEFPEDEAVKRSRPSPQKKSKSENSKQPDASPGCIRSRPGPSGPGRSRFRTLTIDTLVHRGWWRRHRSSKLSREVTPPSTQCTRWCASHQPGGRSHPGATHPPSRTTSARHNAGATTRVVRPTSSGADATSIGDDTGDSGVARDAPQRLGREAADVRAIRTHSAYHRRSGAALEHLQIDVDRQVRTVCPPRPTREARRGRFAQRDQQRPPAVAPSCAYRSRAVDPSRRATQSRGSRPPRDPGPRRSRPCRPAAPTRAAAVARAGRWPSRRRHHRRTRRTHKQRAIGTHVRH